MQEIREALRNVNLTMLREDLCANLTRLRGEYEEEFLISPIEGAVKNPIQEHFEVYDKILMLQVQIEEITQEDRGRLRDRFYTYIGRLLHDPPTEQGRIHHTADILKEHIQQVRYKRSNYKGSKYIYFESCVYLLISSLKCLYGDTRQNRLTIAQETSESELRSF